MTGLFSTNAAIGVVLLAFLAVPANCQETAAAPDVLIPLSDDAIEARLKEDTSFDFKEVPLSDAVEAIGAKHRLPVIIERQALYDLGFDPSTPVTAHYEGISLNSALRLMLSELDLAYVVDEGVLVITSVDEADAKLQTRVYSVYDLVKVHDWMLPPESRSPNKARTDFESLSRLMMDSIVPESWYVAGGPGSITSLPPDLLVITHTRDMHQEVAHLLAALRQLPSADEQNPSLENHEGALSNVGTPVLVGEASAATAYGEIEAALEAPSSLEWSDMPLNEVMRLISERHKIPIVIDGPSLRDAVGIAVDTPVTGNLRGFPLRQGLEHFFEEYELTYVLANEVLFVTTPDVEDNQLTLRVYPVIDLALSRPDADGWQPMDFRSLIKVITGSARPDAWDVAGGPGTISEFQQRAALVVRQTPRIHEEVHDLLTKMRRERQTNGGPDLAALPARDEVVTRSYSLANRDAEMSEEARAALVGLIKRTIRPDSWIETGPDARFITFLPSMIVVHHRRDVQAEVRGLLRQLNLVTSLSFCGDDY